MMIKKVIFAGTPDFAAEALKAIAAAGFDVALVLTQPDRPKGRGMTLQASPVKEAALALDLPVFQPESLRDEVAQAHLTDCAADVMVVAAYGLILPKKVLEIPRYGCLNIHASLLPRWRGAAPIQRAIEAGDSETGVCIMQMDEGLDTGAVLSEHRYTILPTDTAQTVHDELMKIGASAIVADLQHFAERSATPQPESGATYAAKLSKAEAKLDWQLPASVLARRVRAFNPVPGAWCDYQGKPLKVWQAEALDESGRAGQVLVADGQRLLIGCGEGALSLQVVQPAGSKRMAIGAFLAGREIATGADFGA